MISSFFAFVLANLMWVQVPQWSNDWSHCAVDVPDVDCHWYIVNPDSTFGGDSRGRTPHGSQLRDSVMLRNYGIR